MVSVAVWMISYNHEPFIEQAINGFLEQTLNIPKKLFLSIDKSTDKTLQIATDYVKKYPELILLNTYHDRVGYQENFIRNLEAIDDSYQYIAMCEGDDYWCDTQKLQKQIEQLESHEDHVMVFHDGFSLDDNDNVVSNFSHGRLKENRSGIIDSSIIISSPQRMIHLSSICFKKKYINLSLLRSRFINAPVLDTPLINLLASSGKILYIKDKMFYQRNHSESITQQRNFNFEYYLLVKNMLLEVKKVLPEYTRELNSAIGGRYFSYLLFRISNSGKLLDRIIIFIKMLFFRKFWDYSIRDVFYIFRNIK